ncbi:MAG: Hsp33 family molecular chaperone HslO, partial [Clostridia bacterium]
MGKLVKALVEDYLVVTALNSKDIVETARKIHKTSAVATAALGRTLTMCAIMGKNMKNASDYLTVEIKGGGELGKITVCSDSLGNVKGYVDNPNAETHIKEDNHIDVARSVGKDGSITVIKNLGLKEPYLGTCRLVSGEIGEDFAQYFAVSEQQPCAIALGVLVEK